MIHEGIKHDCCQPFWLTQMRVVAGVTEEGEYQGMEGDRAFSGDLNLREGRNNEMNHVRKCAVRALYATARYQ